MKVILSTLALGTAATLFFLAQGQATDLGPAAHSPSSPATAASPVTALEGAPLLASRSEASGNAHRVTFKSSTDMNSITGVTGMLYEAPDFQPRPFLAPDGVLGLAQEGYCLIETEADGMCPMAVPVFVSGDVDLVLSPSAALTLRCLDEQRAGVEDAAVAWLPPWTGDGAVCAGDALALDESLRNFAEHRARFEAAIGTPDAASSLQRWAGDDSLDHASWVLDPALIFPAEGAAGVLRRTNQAGEWNLPALPAGDGYRWLVHDQQLSEVLPTHEVTEVFLSEGGWRMTDGPPQGVSGRFAAPPGAVVELEATLYQQTLLAGFVSLDVPGRGARPQVRVYSKHRHSGPGPDLIRFDEDLVGPLRVDANGYFETLVEPGDKLICVQWIGLDEHFSFATAQVEALSGEYNDAGLLGPIDAPPVSLGLSFRDALSGVAIPADEVFEEGEEGDRAFGSVSLVSRPKDIAVPIYLSAMIPVVAGRPTQLHGLFPGEWVATIADLEGQARDGYRLTDDPTRVDFSVPTAGAVELTIPVVTAVPAQFHLARQTGDPRAVQGYLRPLSPSAADLQPFPLRFRNLSDQLAVADIRVPAGPYELLVVPMHGERAGSNRYASQLVVLTGAQTERDPVRVDLQDGVELTGLLLDGTGRPRDNELVHVSPPGWSIQPYMGITDAQGRFRIHGAIPGTEFRDVREATLYQSPELATLEAAAPGGR